MKKILVVLLTTLLSFTALYAAEKGDSFTLKTIDGKTLHVTGIENGISIQEYKGKIVFLEFWGTHCPPCLMSIPHYIDLQSKYKERLAIVAIEVQGTPETALREFAKAKGMNYTLIPHRNALDFVAYVGQRAGWEGSIPFLIILDQHGTFITGQTGLLPQDALEGVINELEKREQGKSRTASKSVGDTNASRK